MIEKIKPHLLTITVIAFALIYVLKPGKPSNFKRWAYISEDKNSAKWERVIAHIDLELVDTGRDENVRVYYVYAIEWPDSGEIFDANAHYTEKLKTDQAYMISVFSPHENNWNYIRLTGEEVK